MRRFLIICLAAVFTLPAADANTIFWKKKKDKTEKKEKKLSKYEKLFKDKKVETSKGLLTLHFVDKKKLLVEFPVSLMGREFLLGSKVVETSDMGNGPAGTMSYTPRHIKFAVVDSTLYMKEVSRPGQNMIFSSSANQNMQEGLKKNSLSTIVDAFTIAAFNKDSSAVVVDMTSYFVSHTENMNPFSSGKRTMEYGSGRQAVKFKDDLSYLMGVKAFGDNVSIISKLTYLMNLSVGGQLVSVDEPVSMTVNRTLLLLPEKPQMRPRLADPRIGIGTVAMENMGTEVDGSRMEHRMKRWNLEVSDVDKYKRGELTKPKKPIVFYMDPNFPVSWRAAVKAGVNDWNKAFEAIGFKDAIQVKDFPKDDPDFDPDNLKYSTIRYVPTGVVTTMKDASFADPRTGEIMNASLYLYHDLLKWNNIQRFVQTSQVDPDARHLRLPDDLMSETLRCAVRREVGFALGLIENMAGSFAIPTDSLRSASYTQKYGITASVMDEVGFNYVAQPSDKGVMLSPKLGVYDYYAIKVAYKPILEAQTAQEENKVVRQWISEKSGDPMYRFGTKQYLLTTFDPSALSFDLGNDAIKASTYGINNLRYIVAHMHEWMDAEDKNYDYRNMVFPFIVQQLRGYLFNVYRNIGSFYLNEHFVGDANATLTAVPKDLQRASLDFLFTQLKDLEWMDAEDKNYDYRNMVFPFIVQQLRGYLFNVYRNIGSFYLNEHFVGDANATLTAVPKDLQRASLDFLFTQLKDLEWIDDEDVIKKLSFSGSQARKILKNYVVKEKNVITDLYQTKRVSLTYYRDPSSYSPKEYIDDLYELVWRPTMEGRSLTEPERIMQAEFLSNVRNSVDINGQKRWFGQYYLSDDNTDKVGALDEEEDEEAESAIEEQGYGSRAVMYNIATDNQNHLWYGTYQKLAELVKKQQMTGDEQTRAHYKYLLFLMTRSWKDAPKI